MFLSFKKEVSDLIQFALASSDLEIEDPALEESEHADTASSVAFKLAPKYKRSPKELAASIIKAIKIPHDSFIERVALAGPYLNFFVNRRYLDETINRIALEKSFYGGLPGKGKVILEHTSANPNGPLHVGHIRNSIIGDTLARILKKAGYEVATQYYINDMGRQIAIVVWALENFGLEKTKKPDHAVADAYIRANQALEEYPEKNKEIDELMRLIERGDPSTIKKFKDAVSPAMDGIRETLNRLNIYHDKFIWESDFVRSGAVGKIIEEIKKTGRAQMDSGALVLDLKELGIEKSLVVQRKDGTSLYTTRDLAYHEWKASQCDRMINILGADHKLISSQLKAVLRMLGIAEPEIVIFEFVSLPEGSMSTRKGIFISADELFNQIEGQAFIEVSKRRPDVGEEFRRDVAKQVGIGAVRYDVVKVSSEKATTFDWKEALDFEKQGAPFIQYAHARACSILEKAREEGFTWGDFDPGLLLEDQEISLIKKMAAFSYIIDIASRELKPHLLAIYARELAEAFNQFYRYVPVLGAEEGHRKARLALVDCARIVLASALETLGIGALESM